MTGAEVILSAELAASVVKAAGDLIEGGDDEVPEDDRAIIKSEMKAAHTRFEDRVRLARERIAARGSHG